jgi:hypothetical protein
MISSRTRAALAAAKARGVRLGNPRLLARDPELSVRGNAVQVANARRRASSVLPYIEGGRRAGARTLAEIAEALMARGVPAPCGGNRWSPAQVRRTLLIGSTSGGGGPRHVLPYISLFSAEFASGFDMGSSCSVDRI